MVALSKVAEKDDRHRMEVLRPKGLPPCRHLPPRRLRTRALLLIRPTRQLRPVRPIEIHREEGILGIPVEPLAIMLTMRGTRWDRLLLTTSIMPGGEDRPWSRIIG